MHLHEIHAGRSWSSNVLTLAALGAGGLFVLARWLDAPDPIQWALLLIALPLILLSDVANGTLHRWIRWLR
jgi:hypothetical protein